MSFVNNNNERIPGPITGNPLTCLNEKVCIQVKKVFDACMKQVSYENQNVTLSNLNPANPQTPLTYVSGRTYTTRGTISDLVVTPIADKPGLSRVQATVGVPMQMAYTDANGVAGTGLVTIDIPVDIMLGIPEESIIPVEIEAVVGAVAPIGTYVSGSTFTITGCISIIIKCVSEVELLVPSYGYAYIPPCQEFSQDVCSGFYELPLFPGSVQGSVNPPQQVFNGLF
ncbi:MAG: hypothetical protein IKD20_01845 [Clostridia bacterium]|nr:hypothetical protein [Clostridia bacterium]MBR7159757.1 hypothetical protein [Clostridia bacterium]